ncbi:MAG: CoA ester lyase [Pseudomonadota bacterium]
MRSMLFVPGDSERKFLKSLSSGADAIILDLEDSVSLAKKPEARTLTRHFLHQARAGQQNHPDLWVRINSLDTDFWLQDLEAILPAQPDGIMMPKPRSGADVMRLSAELDKLETASALAIGQVKLLPIITETAISVIQMHTYIDCPKRVVAMTWGAEDLPGDIGASTNRDENGSLTSIYQLARDLCLLTSVAAGVQPMDTVFTNFRDDTGLDCECRLAARDGYTGKMAIHPAQIDIINKAFTPTPDDVAHATRIIAAFDATPDAGVASLDGQMLDRPHLTRAQKLLARAKSTGQNKKA